jgi:hypothetical protein
MSGIVKVIVWEDRLSSYETVSARTLLDALAKIPPELLDEAVFEIGDMEYPASVEISYSRPETPAEFQKRERDRVERDAAQARANYAAAEREYLRLKAIFEPAK